MRRYMLSAGIVLLIGVAVASLLASRGYRINECLLVPFGSHPNVTFLGVSTLLIEDGARGIMIDGFFTRAIQVVPSSSDQGKIENALAATNVTTATQRTINLVAVIVNHSHFDHAMDSAAVAEKTGALLVGSESTANIGRGWPLPEDRLRVFNDGQTYCFGRFAVTVRRSGHVPGQSGPIIPGDITMPLMQPQSIDDYKEGGTYSILIRFGSRRMLVQGSAGFFQDPQDASRNPLQGHSADVVYLAVGGLNGQTDQYKNMYWDRVVAAVGARKVYPIHWDNLTDDLSASLPFVFGAQDSINFLLERAQNSPGAPVSVETPVVFDRRNPFEGL